MGDHRRTVREILSLARVPGVGHDLLRRLSKLGHTAVWCAQIRAEALYSHAAKLPRVEIHRPGKVIGRNTVSSMQSGLLYGYAGMVDALVTRIRAEVDFPAKCLATGGLARLLASESSTIETTDELLTLKGLKILYDRNVGGGHPS